jgi:hypothetical protein
MSLARGKTCSCDGSNANCARCFGTGVLQVSGGGDRSRRAVPVPPNCVRCPDCRQFVKTTRLERHRRDVHGVAAGATREEKGIISNSVTADDWTLCPVCHERLKSRRLERHRKKVHEEHRAVGDGTHTRNLSNTHPPPPTKTRSVTADSTSRSRSDCYCYPPPKVGEILVDLLRGDVPESALVCTGCWKEICRVRGLNFSRVGEELWRETCAKRGYLLARANPRGW